MYAYKGVWWILVSAALLFMTFAFWHDVSSGLDWTPLNIKCGSLEEIVHAQSWNPMALNVMQSAITRLLGPK